MDGSHRIQKRDTSPSNHSWLPLPSHCIAPPYSEPKPLHLAAVSGDEGLVHDLLSSGADPSAVRNGIPPVINAITSNHTSIVRLLLEAGGSHQIESPVDTDALFKAVEHDRLETAETVKLLIEFGADVNEICFDCETPHIWLFGRNISEDAAIKRNKVEIAKVLLDAGTKINLENRCGKTAKILAVERGLVPMLETFSETRKFDVEERFVDEYSRDDPHDWPLLHLADEETSVFEGRCGRQELHCVVLLPLCQCLKKKGLLLERGGDVNTETTKGWTTLHQAVHNGDLAVSVLNLLIENGADVDVRTDEGLLPIYVAVLGRLTDSLGGITSKRSQNKAEDASRDPSVVER
ncbi:uncharacterized protein PAC_00253 [Phialocephala subalpina]|uniref:Uncharacterized protein n=1 Tax=Phialocephala subalpina TaxID=576137 RepID=A0A1L7WC70_9HELO|nr:uncharacterized protein PAC_00253 [Phialocephala subalpina]